MHTEDFINLMESIVSTMPGMVYVHDINGRIVLVNEAVTSIMGYTEDELLSMSLFDIDKKIDSSILLASWKKLQNNEELTLEAKNTTKDGRLLDVQIKIKAIKFEESDYFLAIVYDISELKNLEQDFKSNEDLLNTIFYSSPNGMIYQKADGSILKWNNEAERVFGLSEEEIAGQTSTSFPWKTYKEDNTLFEGHEHPSMVTILTGKPSYNTTMKVVRSDESYSWILVNTNPIFDNNVVKGVIISFNDVTELRRIRESLIESQNRVIDLLDAVPDIIAEVDADKKYIWGNNAAYDFFGNDFIGKEAADFFHGNEDIYDKVSPIFSGEKNILHVDSWQKRKDGEIRLLSWNCIATKNDNGSIKGSLASAQDITNMYEINNKLKASEEKFSSIFHQAQVGIVLFDKEGLVASTNNKYLQMFGVSDKEKLTGMNLFDDPNISNEDKYRLRQGETVTIDIEFDFSKIKKNKVIETSKSGKVFVKGIITPWAITDTPEGYFLHVIDTTREKELEQKLLNKEKSEKEEAQHKLEDARQELIRSTQLATIGQIGTSISHDLKNPLGSIRNATYILNKKCPKEADPIVHKYIDLIEKECINASDIINNMLELSKANTLKKSNEYLYDLINDAKSAFDLEEEFKLIYSSDYSKEKVFCDRLKIRQVFINLINNSIQASNTNTEISIEYSTDAENHIIVFSDNGPGIDSKINSNIFDPLVSTMTGGSGMGLTICKMIIEKHGGSIKDSNRKEGGACFTITLPTE